MYCGVWGDISEMMAGDGAPGNILQYKNTGIQGSNQIDKYLSYIKEIKLVFAQ